MDFPDPIKQRPVQPAPKPVARPVASVDPNDLPLRKPADTERLVMQLQRQHDAQMELFKRAEQNITHMLTVIAGWLVCVGALSVLIFMGLVLAVSGYIWRASQSEVWNDLRGPIGMFLTAWAVLILLAVLPPLLLRRLGLRLFKLRV